MASLGQIEDQVEELLPEYARAAGFLAEHEKLVRMLYLATKQQLTEEGLLAKCKTETQIKDVVEKTMIDSNPELFAQAAKAAKVEAFGKVMFKGLDARRSIGQSILGIHKQAAEEARFGKGRPQGGGE
jgi:hypothetical protein